MGPKLLRFFFLLHRAYMHCRKKEAKLFFVVFLDLVFFTYEYNFFRLFFFFFFRAKEKEERDILPHKQRSKYVFKYFIIKSKRSFPTPQQTALAMGSHGFQNTPTVATPLSPPVYSRQKKTPLCKITEAAASDLAKKKYFQVLGNNTIAIL